MGVTPATTTLRRLLVASDLSATSDVAILRAAIQARTDEAVAITVVNVCGHVSETEDAQATLQRRLGALGVEAAEPVVRVGAPFVEIVRTARQVEADLVITGSHGAHWQPFALTGSTAERVVRKGDRPVLVVRERAHEPYARVLTAVDGSEYSVAALRYALAMFGDAQHDVVHAVTIPGVSRLREAEPGELLMLQQHAVEAATTQIVASLDGTWAGDAPIVRYGRPAEVVPDVALECGADLIVVGTHGAGALPYVLLGSVAQHLLRESPVDVLLVRPRGLTFELP